MRSGRAGCIILSHRNRRLVSLLSRTKTLDSFELYTSETNLRNSSVETQSIIVLDFGAQYSQLIARRVRELNVFSVVLPCNAKIEEIRKHSPLGIILSG